MKTTTTTIFFGLVLLITAVTGFAQSAKSKHAPPPSGDGVASAKQFVKVMFPTLRGSDLMINYTLLEDRLDLPVPSYRLEFVVQKFCNPPSDAKVALIGNMFRPCGEYDKNYKDPLRGGFTYIRRFGRLSLYRGDFAGAMVRVPAKGKATTGGVCTEQTFVTKEDVVSSIPRKALEPLLGGTVSIDEVDPQDPYGADHGEWTVRLSAGHGKSRQYYSFSFDACGTLHTFSNSY
jgi:hypothetical protein